MGRVKGLERRRGEQVWMQASAEGRRQEWSGAAAGWLSQVIVNLPPIPALQ